MKFTVFAALIAVAESKLVFKNFDLEKIVEINAVSAAKWPASTSVVENLTQKPISENITHDNFPYIVSLHDLAKQNLDPCDETSFESDVFANSSQKLVQMLTVSNRTRNSTMSEQRPWLLYFIL